MRSDFAERWISNGDFAMTDGREYIGDFFGVPIYVECDFDPWDDFSFEHNGRRTTFRILPDGSMVIIDDEEIED